MRQRKTPRASWYDYTSSGCYFVTICTKDRRHYFGEVVAGEMQLNEVGKQTHICRKMIETFHPHVVCDEFICMQNHIHGILMVGEYNKKSDAGISGGTDYICPIQDNIQDAYNASVQAGNANRCLSESLGSIIRGFKIGVTKFAQSNTIPFARQGRYHDHIVRNIGEYERIKRYIQQNPKNRKKDCFSAETHYR